jgi:branched-chain amino acid transport system ATP-binding protein
MLEVKKLSAGYGTLHILSEVSMSARSNEITVIVGPNGSGKSTLLKSIFGLTNIYSGEITLDGFSLVGLPPHTIARKGIAYLPQTQNIFPTLTVEENLKMAGYTVRATDLQARVSEVAEMFPIVKDRMKRKAWQLSGGERQMLAMSMALLRRPKLMLMDEPTGALAPKIALSVLTKITEIREKLGIAMVLVEQNAKRALETGDRTCLMVSGRTAFEGGAKELLANPQLGRLYLGVGPVESKESPAEDSV